MGAAKGGKYGEDIYVSTHVDDCLICCKSTATMSKFKQELLTRFTKARVKDFITTPPLMHRHSENMTRPPVPKPPATTPDSPDSPARRHETHDRQDWEGLGNRSSRHPKDSQVLRAHQG